MLDAEPNGQFDNVGPYKVPAGHYFMMGDNRDNSTDSREQSPRYGVGYVPYENLVGRAEIIFFSAAVDDPNAFRLTQPMDLALRHPLGPDLQPRALGVAVAAVRKLKDLEARLGYISRIAPCSRRR